MDIKLAGNRKKSFVQTGIDSIDKKVLLIYVFGSQEKGVKRLQVTAPDNQPYPQTKID